MKCEDFDKLIHPYFDGELGKEKSKEIEEHLLTCKNCAAKLQKLSDIAGEAKRIRIPEPSPDYWKTFGQRVRDEIILRRRKSIWVRLKAGWESLFFYSPLKLRIAAGIASILLVFIVGKLYWDYKGKEVERIRSERMERILPIPAQQKPKLQTPAIKESLVTKEPARETTLVKPEPSIVEQKNLQVPAFPESVLAERIEKSTEQLAPTESVISLAGDKAQADKEKGVGEGQTPELKKNVTVTAEGSIIDKGVTASLKTITQEEIAARRPALPETTLYIQKLPEEKSATRMMAQKTATPQKSDKDFHAAEGVKYYKVDKSWVRALTEKDTVVEADTLKNIIFSWKEYFEKKPASEWAPEGFSQVDIAYELLFLKTGDDTLRQQGIKLLNKYKDLVTDQKFKDELTKKISELEALKKK